MRAEAGKWAKAAGSVLAVVSLLFVAALLWREREPLLAFRPDASGLAILLACVGLYAALGVVLALAWRRLLTWAGEPRVERSEAVTIYARTQIAKYIPGNVAQFAGRQLVGRQAGWSHASLLLSTVFELASLVFVAGTIALGAAAAGNQAVDLRWVLAAMAVVFAAVVCLPVLGPPVLKRLWPGAAVQIGSLRARDLWPVGLYHALFFLAGGVILVCVAQVVSDQPVPAERWPALVGLFAVAWIVSTLTPGAPSGIGIRELVVVGGLAATMPTSGAILTAALLRLVTVFGDALFFLFAMLRKHGAAQRGIHHG
ncbi:lysylphosphatidylglycerol synthase domain-containing protein [Aureimonas mangrovi]|uniref:lysylphosphatidylglycerol synthase domain-containing protein n=1 Tax=Aureimonas mangrovi TaxID=2758041 RepID=UPI00163D698D|nr:lysylphosphatidylglycerol synthase domain-containing protein [Aureimonas mangrovi]